MKTLREIPGIQRSRAVVLAMVGLTAASLAAQETAAPPADSLPADTAADRAVTPEDVEDSYWGDMVVLSPFEVTSESVRGYQADRTMSGTRINTRLEDIAASISVVTRQQIEDTAASDINDIFLYEANTEGIYQFTDFTLDESGNQIDNTSTSPATANRMRGLGAAQVSVGGFELNSIPIDTYNVDAVEINRGPNSSIFGVGGGAGTVNLIAGQASPYRSRGRVALQTDSYGGYRVEGDYNAAIIDQVLGVRVSGVHEEKGFLRDPSYDRTDRASISAVVRPWDKTTLRIGYERYRNSNKLPNSLTPYDYVTPWLEAGSPTWNPLTQRLTAADGRVLASGVTQSNVGSRLLSRQRCFRRWRVHDPYHPVHRPR